MFRFPWGDMHSLNLGWFLQKFNELRADWATAEENITGALDAEIQRAEDALSDVFDARDAAAASATAAAGSASSAGTSATAAQNSATAAASSATLANNKATAAGLSEAAAAQSATQAGNSATAAAGSATTASNAATNAAASETAAGNSATAAAGSATAAAGSATAAAASAAAAEAVEESIPEDYTTLSNDVTDLKTGIAQLSNGNIIITEFVEGEYVKGENGEFTPSNPDARTGFVKIPDGVKQLIVDSPVTSPYNAFYSTNDTSAYVAKLRYYVGKTTINIPANAQYFALSTPRANIRNVKVHGVTEYEYKTNATQTIIAPVLDSMIADTALIRNDFRIVDNTLYRITAPIASGAALRPGTNCAATTITAVLKTLLS